MAELMNFLQIYYTLLFFVCLINVLVDREGSRRKRSLEEQDIVQPEDILDISSSDKIFFRPLRIESLQELKDWNKNPTKELPILYDWFREWFFELVMMGEKELIFESHEEHIKFCMICNSFTREEAIQRVEGNVGYWAGYSSEWEFRLKEYFPNIEHPFKEQINSLCRKYYGGTKYSL